MKYIRGGVANFTVLLCDDEQQAAKAKALITFRLDYAFSCEQENKRGGRIYIQDKVEEYADEAFQTLEGY